MFGNTFGRYLKAQRAIIPCWQKAVFLTIEFVSINEILLLSITLSVSPFIEINDFYQHSVTHNNVFTNA